MSISFEKLRATLKTVGVPVTRDKAEKGTDYPYIVYSNVSKGKKMASSKVHRRLPYYQISFFTTGTEKDLTDLENALENAGTVTNFYTYVRCIENGQ